MYRILLVEDEPIIRTAMKTLVQWGKYGFSVAAEANNGVEALQILREHEMDAVFTDIRMPQMDGLELTARINREYPQTHVVLLSAYSDFAYAQQAIRHGVFGYLLKEEDHQKIYDCLQALRGRLDEDRRQRSARQAAVEQIIRQLPQDNHARDALLALADDLPEEREAADLADRNVQLIRDAEAYMRLHYAQPLTLQHMAEHFHISASYFSRLFTQVTGSNYIDRLSEIRLRESRRLLRETDMKVYEIANAVGYRKNRYFSELFKKQYHMSPGEYRASSRRKEAP
ncbi:MAG: response regulator [Aristaeellaceae bacterium]